MRFYLLLSTAVVLLNNSPAFASNLEVNLGTHTHLPLELKSTHSNSFKVAAICALGDNDCGLNSEFKQTDKDMSTGAKKCKAEGFNVTSCSAPLVPTDKCKSHGAYFASCACPTNYKTCSLPEYGVGTVCNGKYSACQRNDEKACKEQNSAFVNMTSCNIGWKLQDTPKCSYNSEYGICCNKCLGFDYSSVPSGYTEIDSCSSCDGTKYKIQINQCNGYQICSNAPADGATKCYSGSEIKYSSCKPTCDNNIYKYDTSNCSIKLGGGECNGKYANCGCIIGDIYFSDGSCSNNLVSGKIAVGIVYDVLSDGSKGNIVNLTKVTANYWSAANSAASTYSTNGKTSGWHMPTTTQLKQLSTNSTKVNNTLSKVGNTLGTAWLWSNELWATGSDSAKVLFMGKTTFEHADHSYKYGYGWDTYGNWRPVSEF